MPVFPGGHCGRDLQMLLTAFSFFSQGRQEEDPSVATSFLAHLVHTVAPASAEKNPGWHLAHGLPLVLNSPASHFWHLLSTTSSPSSHRMHLLDPASETCPGGQGRHLLEPGLGAKDPAAHCIQFSPFVENDPAEQSTQPEFSGFASVPARHFLHLMEPSVEVNVFASHRAHAPSPFSGAENPTGHGVQGTVPSLN